jgi:hypothetical protein
MGSARYPRANEQCFENNPGDLHEKRLSASELRIIKRCEIHVFAGLSGLAQFGS